MAKELAPYMEGVVDQWNQIYDSMGKGYHGEAKRRLGDLINSMSRDLGDMIDCKLKVHAIGLFADIARLKEFMEGDSESLLEYGKRIDGSIKDKIEPMIKTGLSAGPMEEI
jgi:hypothetical protein